MPRLTRFLQFHSLGNHAEGDYSTSTFGIDLTTPDSRSAFDHLMAFPSVKHAVALKGSRFLATEESHSIRVFDVNTGCLQYMLRTPLINDDPTIVLDVCVNFFLCAIVTQRFSRNSAASTA